MEKSLLGLLLLGSRDNCDAIPIFIILLSLLIRLRR